MKSLFALAPVLLGFAAPASAVTFTEAYLAVSMFVTTLATSGGVPQEYDAQDVYALPAAPLTVSKAMTYEDSTGAASASGSASLSFTSAAQGSFTLGPRAASSTMFADAPAHGAGASSYGALYYNFAIDSSSKVSVNYALPEIVQLPGYPPNWTVTLENTDTGEYWMWDGLSGSGTISSTLLQAGNYELDIYDVLIANVGETARTHSRSAGPGIFDFAISAAGVPEPANWALMISGFGLVGGTLRRRRLTRALA